MSEALSSLRAPIDPGRGGVLLANMLASWLDHNRSWTAAAEARDESEDSRTAPPQAGLHLPAPVDAGPSSPPSGEYGAPVRLAREGAGTGLERIPDSHPRPGFGRDRNGDDAAGGLQDLSGRCLDGPGGGGVCPGSLAPGAFESRLAAAAGALRAHVHSRRRRGWLLRPGGFQRRATFRIEGCHGLRRNTFLARPPPRRQVAQSAERRVAFPPAGRLLLRRGKPYHSGSGGRSAGRGEPGVSAVSRNGQRLRGDATLCGGRAAFSQASLWGSLGWEADLGPPDARPGAGLAEEPVLCRAVCLRPFSVSAGDQPRGPGSPTEARGGDARLAGQPARPPPGVYPLGRVPSQSGALGEASNER